MDFDPKDRILLRALQKDGRITNAELAARAGMSESACLRRVRALEERGVIARFSAQLDQAAAGYPLSAFVTVTLSSQADADLKAFERDVANTPEIMECYLMTGSADYLLRVVARSVEDLERIHSSRLTRLSGVLRVNSSIALRVVVKRPELPL